ncbi:MAG: WG repeat-containing protein [Paludibacteraceae bacterium]|nr:WG repeat-containing protein [Paludibacteraceae bacterium]
MKKLIFSMIVAGAMSSTLSAQTQNEARAQSLYFSAVDELDQNNYKAVLAKVAEISKLLGGTNPRLCYLAAKAQYAQHDYAATQAACKNYFASNPLQDPGYAEMKEMAEVAASELEAVARRQREDAEARRNAEAEKVRQEQEEAAAFAKRMQESADRRAQDAELQKLRDEREASEYKAAQTANTKSAYQDFIYKFPSGKLAAEAKAEMLRKWPSPTRTLKNNKYGYVDKSGKMVIKAAYDNASEFSEGLARVGKGNRYGFINEEGKVVIPLNYVAASNFAYGYAIVKPDVNTAFFINKNGDVLGNTSYKDAKSFSEGLAAVQDQYYMYGFVDTKGNVVIDYQFNEVSWFKEGIAAVGKSEGGKMKYGYVDKEGTMLTGFEFQEAKDFQNGVGRVKKDGKYGLVDKFGNPITTYEYDYISDFGNDGLAIAKKAGFEVLLDVEGRPWARVNGKLIKIKL